MVDQLARPKDKAEIYWFSEQPYGHVGNEDLEQFDSGRLGFPNTFFDPHKASILYNEYHEQYALADEGGLRRYHVKRAPRFLLVHEAFSQSGRRRYLQAHQERQDCHPRQRNRHQRPHPHGRGNRHAGLLLRWPHHLRIRTRHRGRNPAGRHRPHREPCPLRRGPRPNHQVLDRAGPLPL